MPTEALAGRTVGVTRQEPGALAEALRAVGATVIHVPLIRTLPPRDPAPLDRALAGIGSFEWVVVTSAPGARAVAEAVRAEPIRLAAVGPGTAAEVLALVGRAPDLVPDVATGAGLVAAFPEGSGAVLVAQADRAGDAVSAGLAAQGWSVTTVVAYRTELAAPTAAELDRLVASDAIVLASGSAVEALVAAIAERGQSPELETAAFVTIGPSTSAVARRTGLTVAAEAAEPTPAGVVAAVVGALGGRPPIR